MAVGYVTAPKKSLANAQQLPVTMNTQEFLGLHSVLSQGTGA